MSGPQQVGIVSHGRGEQVGPVVGEKFAWSTILDEYPLVQEFRNGFVCGVWHSDSLWPTRRVVDSSDNPPVSIWRWGQATYKVHAPSLEWPYAGLSQILS